MRRTRERETEAFLTINLPLKSSVLRWTIRRLKTKKKEREVHRGNVKQPPRTMWMDQDGVERGEGVVFVDKVGCSFGHIGGTLYVDSSTVARRSKGETRGGTLVDVRKGVHRWTVARSD